MRANPLVLVLCGGLAACSFKSNVQPDGGGGGDGAPATLTVSFDTATTVTDEHGAPMIPVHLSQPATAPITVMVSITGGTATPTTDFTLATTAVTFAPGETMHTVDLQIVDDGIAEPDETIELSLAPPSGVGLGAQPTNTVTISASVLPRLSFTLPTSSADEHAATMIEVHLDTASPLQITTDFTLGGTATQGADYTLAPGTITFAPSDLAKSIALGEIADGMDEDDETVIVTLTNPTNAIISNTEGVHTHTIVDVDDPPTVTIAASSTMPSVSEAVGTTTFTLTLSAKSGKTITVPVTADPSSTATMTADYTFASPVTIPPNTLSVPLTVTVVDDTIDEDDETIVAKLGTPTNATLGGTTLATITILDNDLACYGSGTFAVCFNRAPSGAKSFGTTTPLSIDTSPGSAACAGTQPVGWSGQGEPDVCLIAAGTITIGTVTATGPRPLVFAADQTISITTSVRAGSYRTPSSSTGPGSPAAPLDCGISFHSPISAAKGGGGGAGGSFMTAGGDGGTGDTTSDGAGSAASIQTSPTKLRAGCAGQVGGGGASGQVPGAHGRGGGVVYFVAGTQITIGGSGIDASGSSSSGGDADTGGGGGGSGGMIMISAPTISVTGTAKVIANGGGAASGGSKGVSGTDGNDPTFGSSFGGIGPVGGGDGGGGYFGSTAAVSGTPGASMCAGGGGGGGGGYIKSSMALPAGTASAGVIE